MGSAKARRHTALIVEDDRGQSELAAMMLREFDLDVTQCSFAEDAIAHLCAHEKVVDVALIDIHLSGDMDGIALAKRISVLWPTISVIVTSGDISAGRDSLPGNTTFLPKPWVPLDIVAAAERAASQDHSVRSIRF